MVLTLGMRQGDKYTGTALAFDGHNEGAPLVYDITIFFEIIGWLESQFGRTTSQRMHKVPNGVINAVTL
ncbi:hypothetical protein NQ318_017034 [Aromia moschata]|uniref:Uncharacterized protein n=1 Tax=Aromia moschata TaxID=1265417 RepID=A0AAV8X8U5_9CUCU|nr:hypothetical protein NQ318_017034 [Aromia moschata]